MKKTVLIIAALAATVGLSAQGVSVGTPKAKPAQFNSTVKLEKKEDLKSLVVSSKPQSAKSLQLNANAKKELKNSRSLADKFTLRKEAATDVSALYFRPFGYFYAGLSKELENLTIGVMVGPAYEPATWYNASENAEKIEWTFTNPETFEGTVTFTEDNPTVKYPWAEFDTPALKATAGANDSTYTWFDGIVRTGGNSDFLEDGTIFGLGNYDLNLDFMSGMYDTGVYIFGTGSEGFWGDYKVTSIANYFEKPLHKYLFNELWVNTARYVGSSDAEFQLIIHRVDTETMELTDTIATAVCYGSDVLNAGVNKYNTIPFIFYAIDPETGREEQVDIEIEDAILIELKGFVSSKVSSLDPVIQADPHPTGESNAYIFLTEIATGDVYLANVGDEITLGGEAFNTSFLFNMNVTYPFMFADENKKKAPDAGGVVNFDISSYWVANAWWLGQELPEWITIGTPIEDATSIVVTLPVTVAALPSGVDGRSAKFTIKSFATDVTLEVTQGNSVGVSTNVVDSAIKAVRQGDSFVLSYPADVTAVAVYNVLGAKVTEYALSADGEFTLPAAGLANGAYVLKFAGASKSIKIVK